MKDKNLGHSAARGCPSLPGAPMRDPVAEGEQDLAGPIRVFTGTGSLLRRVPSLRAAPLPPLEHEAPAGEPSGDEVDAWYVIEVVA